MTTQSKPAFRFLDLPPELRLRVYSYLLVENGSILPGSVGVITRVVTKKKNTRIQNMTVGLLRTCKMICEEATPVLYGENLFRMVDDKLSPESFLPRIGRSIRYLRRVYVSLRRDQKDCRRKFALLTQATHLSHLRITLCFWHRRWTSEKIAKEVGPLVRSLHKSRKKDSQRKERNVLDILSITSSSLCPRCRDNPGTAKRHEEEIKELLAKTLK